MRFPSASPLRAKALHPGLNPDTRKGGLPAPSRIEGAGELIQGKSGTATRSRTKQEKGDQRASIELVPATKKRASRAGSLLAVVRSG
jgi:hypothetical protein